MLILLLTINTHKPKSVDSIFFVQLLLQSHRLTQKYLL